MDCPYCNSDNIDLVDMQEDSIKYKCCDCGEDFIEWEDGIVTDRHGQPVIYKGGDVNDKI